ncbi:MAG: AMP-binding protein [Phycisphaerales bacterium]|nr:AMP-binding protein [Phycisphaerales bacterium]
MLTLQDGSQARAYRTGDRVYELPDGNIVFDGRIDEQVKIRGFRVELGAIEAAIEQIDGIKRASVVMCGQGDRARLHARVIGEPMDPEAVLSAVARVLPEYMVPDDMEWLDELPITANGKVDKRALVAQIEAQITARSLTVYREPETETQKALCAIWEVLLERERIGIDDSFFDLGGHSLRAVVMCSRIRDRFGVAVSAPLVLRSQTIRAIGDWIDREIQTKGSRQLATIPRVSRAAPLPISFNQERLWVLDQMYPADPSYNISMRLVFAGDLDEQAARGAWSDLHERHETLRTRIIGTEQVILGMDQITPVFRWDDAVDESELEAIESREFARVFDLSEAPLARMCVYKLTHECSILAVTIHHIVSDAWSCTVLRDEFEALYLARVEGRSATLPELAIQYADFASWQRSESQQPAYKEHLDYWTKKLSGAPMLDLPADSPRYAEIQSTGDRVHAEIPADLVKKIQAMSSEKGVTPNAVVLAAFNAWLHRLMGAQDVVIGMPVASRSSSSLEPLIGFFMETIAMRVPVQCSDHFGSLVDRTSEELWESIEHSTVAFQHVIQTLHGHATPGRNPLFEVFFNYITAKIRGGDGHRFAFDDREVDNHTAKFDLTCYVFDEGDTMSVVFNYRSALFTETTMRRFLEQYITLLGSAIEHPNARLSSLDILAQDEADRWEAARVGSRAVRPPCCLHDAFDSVVEKHPSRVAVISPLGQSSYAELQKRSQNACNNLIAAGVMPGDRVVVGLRDPIRMAAAILGILRTGAVYVPVDLGWPSERIHQLIGLSGARHAVLESTVPIPAETVRIDPSGWEHATAKGDARTVDPSEPCYLMFTSGSTGAPKGVLQSHAAVHEHNTVFADSLQMTPEDRVLMLSSQGFDAAPMDMYSAWFTGAAWCPFDLQHERADDLVPFIENTGITVFHAAPSVLRWFASLGADPESLRSVRVAVMGGEPARSEDLDLIRAHFSKCARIINGLGLTESSVSFQNVLTPSESEWVSGQVPIGRATAGVTARLVDADGQPTTLFGELELESRRIAIGYWNPENHNPDPIGVPSEDGTVRFRTGDLAGMSPDGLLVHRGRRDQQVQVHGCRVETGEVQAAARNIAGIADAAVLARKENDAGHTLIAYLVPKPGTNITASEVRRDLGAKLPGYMVPAEIRLVEKIKRVGGGKIDQSALRALAELSAEKQHAKIAGFESPTAEAIAQIFSEILDCAEISGGSDFFLLGGTSLKAIRVFARLREQLDTAIPVSSIFRSPTPNALAELIDREQPNPAESLFIPMKNGHARAVYMLPGVGGHPLGFGAMITHINTDARVLGVQLPGLDGKTDLLKNIPELAAYIIDRMSIKPSDPAPDMVGYSFGGALAFEIALRLQTLGHKSGVLVLLDSHNLNGLDKKSTPGLLLEHLLSVLGKGEVNGPRYLIDKLRGRGVSSTTAMTKDTGDPAIDRMIRTNRRAVVDYKPDGIYRGPITLIRARQPEWLRYHRDDGNNGWARWTKPGNIRVINLDVRHMSLLQQANASSLGGVISDAIGH